MEGGGGKGGGGVEDAACVGVTREDPLGSFGRRGDKNEFNLGAWIGGWGNNRVLNLLFCQSWKNN